MTRTLLRQSRWVVLLLATAAAQIPAGQRGGSSSTQQKSAKSHDRAVADALKNDTFKLTEGEYNLTHPINLNSSPNKKNNVEVQYQLGTIEGKPATVNVLVDKKKAPGPQEADKADEMFGRVPSSQSVHVEGLGQDSFLQKCRDGKKCVKTENDRCIKWVCS